MAIQSDRSPFKLVQGSRFGQDQPFGFQLNGIEQFNDRTEFLEVVKRLVQQEREVDIARRIGLAPGRGSVEYEASEAVTVPAFEACFAFPGDFVSSHHSLTIGDG